MLERKRLTCTELLENYATAGVNCNNYKGMNKEERRVVWKAFCDKHYPLLASCPFCGSTVNEGVEFTAKYFLSISNGGGCSDTVHCSHCDLTFKGNYYEGSVVDQWNRIGN